MNNKFLSVILISSLLVVAFFLVFEHRAHIFGNLQYLLFAAFIGLHFFMHAGHGGHGNHKDQESHGEHKKGGTK